MFSNARRTSNIKGVVTCCGEKLLEAQWYLICNKLAIKRSFIYLHTLASVLKFMHRLRVFCSCLQWDLETSTPERKIKIVEANSGKCLKEHVNFSKKNFKAANDYGDDEAASLQSFVWQLVLFKKVVRIYDTISLHSKPQICLGILRRSVLLKRTNRKTQGFVSSFSSPIFLLSKIGRIQLLEQSTFLHLILTIIKPLYVSRYQQRQRYSNPIPNMKGSSQITSVLQTHMLILYIHQCSLLVRKPTARINL